MHEKSLLSADFEGVVSFLTHLPDSLSGSELFRHIEPFMRSYPVNCETARSKKRFFQVRKQFGLRYLPIVTKSKELTVEIYWLTVEKMLLLFTVLHYH